MNPTPDDWDQRVAHLSQKLPAPLQRAVGWLREPSRLWLRVGAALLLILGGILIGPEGLGIEVSSALQLIANIGLGFVFLLAGFEIDPAMLFARAGKLALWGWLISLGLAAALVGLLAATGYVQAFVPVALALTTTALGTVLPILREHDLLGRPFGHYFLAAGAFGELFWQRRPFEQRKSAVRVELGVGHATAELSFRIASRINGRAH